MAKTYTNKNGLTSFETGFGDLLIWAHIGNTFGFEKVTVSLADTVIITIKNSYPNGQKFDFDMVPPKEGKITQVNQANAKHNEVRLLQEDSIRTLYMKTFLDSNSAKELLAKIDITDNKFVECLIKSYGNHDEIYKFISQTKPENRKYALKLLNVISEKDLRDTRAYILSNQFNSALKFINNFNNNEDIWADYVLNCRIANEMMVDYSEIGILVLTNWRAKKYNNQNVNGNNKYLMLKDIIDENIKIDTIANAHSRAPITPLGVYKLKTADPISRDIFFIALCRSLGIACRLNQLTSIPQIYINKDWIDVNFDSKIKTSAKKSYIKFINKSTFDPKYYSNFTLEHFNDGTYQTLEFDDIKPISEFADSLEVPSGNYMLVTGNRKN